MFLFLTGCVQGHRKVHRTRGGGEGKSTKMATGLRRSIGQEGHIQTKEKGGDHIKFKELIE